MPDDETIQEVIAIPMKDAMLALLVKISDVVGYPVTLFISGTIITGRIIPIEKYMELTAAEVRRTPNTTGQDTESFQKAMNIIADGIDAFRTSLAQSADETPTMIHLENVKILIPATGATCNLENGLWRGSLASVDAFILGGVGN